MPEPDIYTEFGKYTVGESGAIIFEVLEQKQQNDTECWYLINNSLMNTIPDAWSINEKFILLPINKWKNEYQRVHIGGISCDHSDYYNSEDLNQDVLLPAYDESDEKPLYLGFFHTGAYQDAISGYGGIKHCLIPCAQTRDHRQGRKGKYRGLHVPCRAICRRHVQHTGLQQMRSFAGIEEKYCSYDNAEVLLQSIPYDGTSTWGKGADKGFAAFLDALENMELYDIETDSEAYTTWCTYTAGYRGKRNP